MLLTNVECKGLKPKNKSYKKFDGAGLYLEIMPSGKKFWRFRYRFDGKEKRLSFGEYPIITLKEARDKQLEARKLLAADTDPSAKRKEDERERKIVEENTFEKIAREWHDNKKSNWTEKYAETIINRLEEDVFPEIGKLPISEVKPLVLVDMIRKIEKRGVYETTRRILQYCSQIFRYAVATGRVERDYAIDVKDAIKTKPVKHHAAISPEELPELLLAIEQNKSRMFEPTILAVKFMLLTFVRTNELLKARWHEFNFEERKWTIPAERMKMRKEHVVPLCSHAIEILERLKELHGHREWVFASYIRPKNPMSNGVILAALKRMGFNGRMTGHGFRALALTTLIEKRHIPFEVADAQLAHSKRNSLGSAYDRAQYLEQRRDMMQIWGDYIEELRQETLGGHIDASM